MIFADGGAVGRAVLEHGVDDGPPDLRRSHGRNVRPAPNPVNGVDSIVAGRSVERVPVGVEGDAHREGVRRRTLRLEPFEMVSIDIPETFTGVMMEKMALRRGEMAKMVNHGSGRVLLDFLVHASINIHRRSP